MRSRLWGWLRRRWAPLTIVVVLTAVLGAVLASFLKVEWGDPGPRVTSPTGELEVVQYEWRAMVDPGWTLAIERVDGDGREWFWRSVESPGPESIRFSGPTSVEITDHWGAVYQVDFDPDSLEPSDRFCLRPEYCYSAPWDDFTRTEP